MTIVGGLLRPDGSLRRSWKDGRAVGQGVLEDYTHLADGLLALYEATFESLVHDRPCPTDRVLTQFADPAGAFFDTADDHERLVTDRGRPGQRDAVGERDGGASPAPGGGVDGGGPVPRRGRARDPDRGAVRDPIPDRVRTVAGRDGPGARAGVEVAIVGGPEDPATAALIAETRRGYRPNEVVAVAADPPDERYPAHGGAGRDRRSRDRVCLSWVRLPARGRSPTRSRSVGTPPRPMADVAPVEPRRAATVVLLRGDGRSRDAPDAATVDDGVRG